MFWRAWSGEFLESSLAGLAWEAFRKLSGESLMKQIETQRKVEKSRGSNECSFRERNRFHCVK